MTNLYPILLTHKVKLVCNFKTRYLYASFHTNMVVGSNAISSRYHQINSRRQFYTSLVSTNYYQVLYKRVYHGGSKPFEIVSLISRRMFNIWKASENKLIRDYQLNNYNKIPFMVQLPQIVNQNPIKAKIPLLIYNKTQDLHPHYLGQKYLPLYEKENLLLHFLVEKFPVNSITMVLLLLKLIVSTIIAYSFWKEELNLFYHTDMLSNAYLLQFNNLCFLH